ncbi:hypothetical protein CLAIMM_03134 [Cladophialophora immunda]|nr:hypothetical protein CLAIMM_03134 [Cladophialophora immunda]
MMARCRHSDWLNLRIERNEVILCISDRLQTLIDEIPSPDLQQPSLLVFIGHTAKLSALRLLGVDKKRQKSAGRRKRGGGVHLQQGNPDVFHDVPVLLADGDLPYRALKKMSSAQCHETRQLMLPRIRGGVRDLALEDAADHLYSRLLGAFADVFCFFSTDVGGFGPVVRRLASWLENGKPTTLPKTTYPRMVVVMEATDPGAESDKGAEEVLLGELREETTKNPLEMVSALEVVTVPHGGQDYRRLEEFLVRALNQGRRQKIEARTLFSGRHLTAFFRCATDHFGRTTREPFDFVQASRLRNPVASDLGTHLSNFLKQIKSPEELMDFAVPMIASSLLLDHYPPGMHALREVTVKVKPDTAGVNVLTIDGGGIKGIVPLLFLQILQDRVGLPIPVQDNFEISFGTSSGGLIVLALFIMGWSVEDCANIFESFAKRAFRPRWVSHIPVVSRIPVLSHILEFLVSYLADGLYPADNLEAALKAVFGGDMGILDNSYATAIGAKVGIPVTTVLETDPCLFTNYNGAGTRPQDCGYRIVRSQDVRKRIRLWEIAMSGAAAPWYFPAKRILGAGTFQDGALWRNNPVDLALWEIPVVWPLIRRPNVVVSLGTGSPGPRVPTSHSSRLRAIWREGFLPRSYRAFMELINGQKIAQAFKNGRRAELDGRYFRFDVELDREVDLDDTSGMRGLATKAREQFCRSEDVDVVARCLVATRFYFELESKPKKIKGKYCGSGHIFCCLPRNSPGLEMLLEQLSRRAARFIVNGHWTPGSVGDRSFIDHHGTFRKRVEFETKDTLSVLLQEGPADPQHISGSPYAVPDLMDVQGLNNDFGTPDHRKRKEREETEDEGEKRREEPAKKCRRAR